MEFSYYTITIYYYSVRCEMSEISDNSLRVSVPQEYEKKNMSLKNVFCVWSFLRDINKLKDEHYYYYYYIYIDVVGRSGIQVFSLLPVSWSAFPSPADQSRYSERSYCTQILQEGYIIYPIHQSMFFAFLYHIFSMFYM